MMTREEAIEVLENGGWWDLLIPITTIEGRVEEDKLHEALDLVLAALRPVSREQVEKVWRGEWEWYDEEVGAPLEGIERDWGWRCSKCKVVLPDDFDDPDNPPAMSFCQRCGAPMTDEAVQMVMKRLEALKDGKDN